MVKGTAGFNFVFYSNNENNFFNQLSLIFKFLFPSMYRMR